MNLKTDSTEYEKGDMLSVTDEGKQFVVLKPYFIDIHQPFSYFPPTKEMIFLYLGYKTFNEYYRVDHFFLLNEKVCIWEHYSSVEEHKHSPCTLAKYFIKLEP